MTHVLFLTYTLENEIKKTPPKLVAKIRKMLPIQHREQLGVRL